MKKIIYTIIIICSFLAINISANAQNAGITTIGSYSACPGTNITVPITWNTTTGTTSYGLSIGLKVTFSTSYLSYVSFNSNGSGLSASYTGGNSYVTLICDSYWFTDNQIIGYLTFYYNNCGTTTIILDNINGSGGYCEYTDNYGDPLYDNNGSYSPYYVNGTITCNGSIAPTSATANPSTICEEATWLTQSGGSLASGAKWNWYTGSCGGTLVKSTTTTNALFITMPTVTTTYWVRAEGGTCGITTSCVSVTVTVSCKGDNSNESINIKNTNESINNMLIYPNPANDIVNIDYNIADDGLVTISLYNVLGEKVIDVVNTSQNKGSHKSNIDLKSVPTGVYTVKMITGNNSTIVKSIVINK